MIGLLFAAGKARKHHVVNLYDEMITTLDNSRRHPLAGA
jgi:hypothetical protein